MQKNAADTIPVFPIGITMAGAASAGCYTAGAMDYLFELLDLWEKAKNQQLPDDWGHAIYSYIPQHKVVIDAMGGTSAGGMTTIMSAIYALKGKINPVSDPANKGRLKDNVFYDSWVLMGDTENADEEKLLAKTFDVSDLDESGKIQSLLNSGFIDAICDAAFADDVANKQKPSYVADNLEVVLSHTMLRSIPLAVNFTTPISKQKKNKKSPEHCSFDHFTISHFRLDHATANDGKVYLPLDPFGPGAKTMKLATMATGAFPIGLRFREFFLNELPVPYLKSTAQSIAFNRFSGIPATEPDQKDITWPDSFKDPFAFVSVDGGAINNEPFGEVLGILKNRYGIKKPDDYYKYALIMIDPFPDIPVTEEYKQPDDLFSVVPAVIGTLYDQAKVKRAEMLDAYSSDYYRGEIFPIRWKQKDKAEHHPIACGAAMAFGGFLDIDFRHHDFFLGRDNARNFLRTFFTLEYDPDNGIIHPIHANWTPEMVDLFKMPGKDGKIFLPIIPDLYWLRNKLEGNSNNPFHRSVPEWPQYDPENLFALRGKMKKRVKKMMELAYTKITGDKEVVENPLTSKWLGRYYKNNFIKRFFGWIGSGVIRILFAWNKGKLANRITKAAISWILKDLEAKGLLKPAKKK